MARELITAPLYPRQFPFDPEWRVYSPQEWAKGLHLDYESSSAARKLCDEVSKLQSRRAPSVAALVLFDDINGTSHVGSALAINKFCAADGSWFGICLFEQHRQKVDQLLDSYAEAHAADHKNPLDFHVEELQEYYTKMSSLNQRSQKREIDVKFFWVDPDPEHNMKMMMRELTTAKERKQKLNSWWERAQVKIKDAKQRQPPRARAQKQKQRGSAAEWNNEAVWARFFGNSENGECPVCKNPFQFARTGTWHKSHIVAKSIGGAEEGWNCIPLCPTCNGSYPGHHLQWIYDQHPERVVPVLQLLARANPMFITRSGTLYDFVWAGWARYPGFDEEKFKTLLGSELVASDQQATVADHAAIPPRNTNSPSKFKPTPPRQSQALNAK